MFHTRYKADQDGLSFDMSLEVFLWFQNSVSAQGDGSMKNRDQIVGQKATFGLIFLSGISMAICET